jgi:hypothetical protein
MDNRDTNLSIAMAGRDRLAGLPFHSFTCPGLPVTVTAVRRFRKFYLKLVFNLSRLTLLRFRHLDLDLDMDIGMLNVGNEMFPHSTRLVIVRVRCMSLALIPLYVAASTHCCVATTYHDPYPSHSYGCADTCHR